MNTAERAELTEKLRHAEEHLHDAENVRALLAVGLADVLGSLRRDEQTLELHVADVRVDLWRQMVAELRERLGLR